MDRLSGRRTFRRFHLAVPALFRWRDEQQRQEIGCCTNIGMGGMFVLTSRCPPLDTEVMVEIILPAFKPSAPEIRLNCAGRVIRTQDNRHLGAGGFAVAGSFE
ncbi:MAG: PilZ domain-containing protein [Terriglobales bacterium]